MTALFFRRLQPRRVAHHHGVIGQNRPHLGHPPPDDVGETPLVEACARLAGVTKLTREEMRLAGYPDSMPEIDVCEWAENGAAQSR
jgi:hypothetical protein